MAPGVLAEVLLACLGGLLSAQGVATRGAAPEAKPAFSGKLFGARFTDVAVASGLQATITVGNPTSKNYIIEANAVQAPWS